MQKSDQYEEKSINNGTNWLFALLCLSPLSLCTPYSPSWREQWQKKKQRKKKTSSTWE